MQCRGSFAFETHQQFLVQGRINRRHLGYAAQKVLEIHACAAHKERDVVPSPDFKDLFPGKPNPGGDIHGLVRVQPAVEMVRAVRLLLCARLGRNDGKIPVQLPGIAVDNFSLKLFCQFEGQCSFSCSGGPCKAEYRKGCRHIRHCRRSFCGPCYSLSVLFSFLFQVALCRGFKAGGRLGNGAFLVEPAQAFLHGIRHESLDRGAVAGTGLDYA